MKRDFRTIYNKLKKMGVPVYEYDNTFRISAEEINSSDWLEYWWDVRPKGWDFGLNPELDKIARQYDCYFEWVDASCVECCW